MNAISGIFHRNNQPVSSSQLEGMSTALRHRGPDGISSVTSCNVGLVSYMLHDTPESLFEKLPATCNDKRLLITWSGRIDNREDLKAKTGWKHQLSKTTDSDLILAAYKKWGHDCAEHLLGDYAIAIWDNSTKELFCIRDHMGVKPFYYILNKSFFFFSSEIKGLKVQPSNDGGINEDRIADFLTGITSDTQSTFYNNILRLPPGHHLTIGSEESTLSCYWKPHPSKHSCRNNHEYEEQFYSIFKEATRCRLRSAFPVGSFLSGGLDSSSIVCMATGPLRNHYKGQFHTFSGIFDKITECDERKYFHSILDRYDILPHCLYGDGIDPGNAYDQISISEDEPFWAPHFFMAWQLIKQANRNGVRVLLDGHDGDSAVSHGYGLLPELLIQGHFLRLFQECRVTGNSTSLKKTIRFFLSVFKERALYKTSCFLPFLQTNNLAEMTSNLSLPFQKHNNIKDRLITAKAKDTDDGMTEYTRHKLAISHPRQQEALEFYDNQCAKHKMTSRYPFFDKRLIEFCLALPAEQKRANGYNRRIMRESLKTILPPAIAKRKTKTDFMPNMVHSFAISNRKWLQFNIDRIPNHAYNYVNREKLHQVYDSFTKEPQKVSLFDLGFLLRSISLALWLDKN